MINKSPFWTPEAPAIHRVGRVCARNSLGYFLVQRVSGAKSNKNKWEFPGGQCDTPIEFDEPSIAAQREAGEETGLTLRPASTKPIDVFIKPMIGGDKHGHVQETYTYSAHITSDDLLSLPEFQLRHGEIQDAALLSLEAAFRLELTEAARQTLGRIATAA